MAPQAIRRKLVIVGDGASGKTSLLSVFAMGEFPKEYHPTIFENYVAEIRLDGKPVQLALWDTAGQEEYERLRPLSYSKSHIILIAFSIDTPDSLDNVLSKWIEEVRSICGPDIPVMLVGCKRDLRDDAEARGDGSAEDERRFVSFAKGEATAREIGAKFYKECSSLHNSGVDDVFEAATRQAMLVRTGASSSSAAHNHGTLGGTVTNGRSTSGMDDRRKSTMLSIGGTGSGNSAWDEKDGNVHGSSSKGCCIVV
ncbi:ras-domain-containing protein [Cystobasidium minutum MCA 4210]|uniref:ras-domain-containing protein n=1 Tax=Cystobasidium minutum MCA 4210 TaxID=1397322 RepID=UPI0034CEE08B|eukprot:jgi/Rhomi1/87771/CE87770_4927